MNLGTQFTIWRNLVTSAGRSPIQDRCSCQWSRTDTSRLPWDTAAYGGWGGAAHFGTDPGTTRPPVVFVHGSGRDACDWERAADYFRARGCLGDDLWAITFRDALPTHAEMAVQLDAFITRVRAETGADRVSLIAHSLGVTGVRYWLTARDRAAWVDTVVALAGANHGMPACRLPTTAFLDDRHRQICGFLTDRPHASTEMTLSDLNAAGPADTVTYYTIRGRYDSLFIGHWDSPVLDGAVANVELRTDHEGVRTVEAALDRMYEWTGDGQE